MLLNWFLKPLLKMAIFLAVIQKKTKKTLLINTRDHNIHQGVAEIISHSSDKLV